MPTYKAISGDEQFIKNTEAIHIKNNLIFIMFRLMGHKSINNFGAIIIFIDRSSGVIKKGSFYNACFALYVIRF
ncbi:hypothetical protein GCM10022395_34260 [Snuella lapsa]|uniref:Uncharacterized protein n=1 Tax=Snuella lapsa TaxID=870481 RepID=A0ABP6YG99_9FLAO